jgi:hypothetical protein
VVGGTDVSREVRVIEKVNIKALRNLNLLVNEVVINIPAGNNIWLKNPSVDFLRGAEEIKRKRHVVLKYVYGPITEKSNWKKEGF